MIFSHNKVIIRYENIIVLWDFDVAEKTRMVDIYFFQFHFIINFIFVFCFIFFCFPNFFTLVLFLTFFISFIFIFWFFWKLLFLLSSVFFHFLSFHFLKWNQMKTSWPRTDIRLKINHDGRRLTYSCATVVY